jgi:hypothetical protein
MTVWQVCHGGMHDLTLVSKNTKVREEQGNINSSSERIRYYQTDDHSMMQTAIGSHPPIFAELEAFYQSSAHPMKLHRKASQGWPLPNQTAKVHEVMGGRRCHQLQRIPAASLYIREENLGHDIAGLHGRG